MKSNLVSEGEVRATTTLVFRRHLLHESANKALDQCTSLHLTSFKEVHVCTLELDPVRFELVLTLKEDVSLHHRWIGLPLGKGVDCHVAK